MIRPGPPALAAPPRGTDGVDPADVLGGSWHEVEGQRFVVVERAFRPGYRHGRLSVADSLPPSDGVWPALDLLARTPCRQGLLFVDLETTGLMGGAGTYAFLVGCAWFDGGVFRLRQYLMSSVTGERGLLLALADLARDSGTVVTYNGKSFDLPLIETRFLFHRMASPFAGMPHVDMLHPARRLWRPLAEDAIPAPSRGSLPMGESACRLTTLERTLWGVEREGDVPGYEIPDRYFSFVRSGDARPLDAVLEHNRLDLLSLACVTAHACQMLDAGPFGARSPREALGLGRIFLSGGRLDEARECFAAAGGLQAPTPGKAAPMVQIEALRALALVSRRQRRFDDAAAAWQRVVDLPDSPAHIVREATEALAVHYEHRRRDIPTARSLALQALTHGEGGRRENAIRHRVARLDRKLGAADAGAAGTSLF